MVPALPDSASRHRVVLGIADGHDAGAALVVDGRLVGAVSEERLTRIPHQAGFPWRSIAWCLSLLKAEQGLPGLVVVAEKYGRAPLRRHAGWYARQVFGKQSPLSLAGLAYTCYQNAVPHLPKSFREAESVLGRKALQTNLWKAGLGKAEIVLEDHHACHAAAAGASMPWPEAVCLTADAYGDGVSAAIWILGGKRPHRLWVQYFPFSAALLYGLGTVLLGFKQGDEGKVMGLAAMKATHTEAQRHGERRAKRGTHFPFLAICSQRFRWLWKGRVAPHRQPSSAAVVERAAWLQEQAESWALDLVRRVAVLAPRKPLALSGGLFANVKVNQRIRETGLFPDVFVFPHMGDGGLAVGAAALGTGGGCQASLIPTWGPDLEEDACVVALRGAGLPFYRPDNLAELTAEFLAEGMCVATCRGPAEFGPRALGNRSFLFRANRPDIAEQLNKTLRRPDYMPFAPAIREEALAHALAGTGVGSASLPHMTMTWEVGAEFRERYPVAVHVDGTCRPQAVSRTHYPWLKDVLDHLYWLNGNEVVINTSFNLHGEPIVCGPIEALRTFWASGADALVLGPFWVVRGKM